MPLVAAGAAALLLVLAPFMPAGILGHVMVFVLACIIGFFVIGIVYGIVTGTIKTPSDIPDMIIKGL